MCNHCSEASDALKHLIASRDGVVSFEYVLVAAAIVGAVAAVFGTTDSTGPINDTLAISLNTIVNKVTTAVGG